MTPRSIHRKPLAFAGIAALAAAALLTTAGTAGAAPHWAETNPPTTGSLTVTKLVNDGTATFPGTGQASDRTGLTNTPIAGAEIEICRVRDGADSAAHSELAYLTVSSAEWWVAINQVKPGDFTNDTMLDCHTSDPTWITTTTANGVATWPSLDLGLYLVRDINTPAPYEQFDAFLVPVPMHNTNVSGVTTPNYNVNVFPKSPTSFEFQPDIHKTATVAPNAKIGDPITYALSAAIPEIGTSQQLEDYAITDTLDSLLTFVSAANQVIVRLAGGSALAATDYTVAISGQTLTVTFTDDGLAVLAAASSANPNDRVVVEFQARATAMGSIPNEANVAAMVSGTEVDNDSNRVDVAFYGHVIHKLSSDASITNLAGAQFTVHACGPDTGLLNPGDTGYVPTPVGAALQFYTSATAFTAPQTTATTDPAGIAIIAGLVPGTYCVRETVPLAGHSPISEFAVNVATVILGTEQCATAATTACTPITNTPIQTTFTLPLVGSVGTWFFGIVAAAGIATTFVVISRKAKKDATAEAAA